MLVSSVNNSLSTERTFKPESVVNVIKSGSTFKDVTTPSRTPCNEVNVKSEAISKLIVELPKKLIPASVTAFGTKLIEELPTILTTLVYSRSA